jgi:hypothetical protein
MSSFINRPRRIQPRITVQRSDRPYTEEQGWQRRNGGWFGSPRLEGFYRTRFGSFKGEISIASSNFFIFDPPDELRHHPHWICFSPRGGGKYAIHFAVRPRDIDSGILQVERLLHESFTKHYTHR